MATQAEIQATIDTLTSEIREGVAWTMVEGTQVRVDLEVKKQERARLERELASMKAKQAGRRGSRLARPVDLGGF